MTSNRIQFSATTAAHWIRLGGAALLLAATVLTAAEPGAAPQAQQAPVKEDSRLPRVMIVGDSISGGYTDEVRVLLAGKANIFHARNNAGPSSSGVQKVDEWVASGTGHWDVIHFNFGLHDIKLGTGGKDNKPYPTSDGHQIPAEDYERNLRQIVARLKLTGATLIWCSTTPVPDGRLDPPRHPGDEVKYNEIARKVMQDNGVVIDDLYDTAKARLAEIQLPRNVHYTKAGSVVLAKQVASSIEMALEQRRR